MKNRRILKVVALLLSVMLVSAFALTGCGNQASKTDVTTSEGTTNASSNVVESTSDGKDQLAPYELIYYYGIGAAQPDQELVQTELSKLLKERINATIKLNGVEFGTYGEKMRITLAAGDPVDVCFTSSWVNVFSEQVSKGAFLDLGDLYEKYGQDIKNNLPEGFVDAGRIDGKLYAIPNVQYCATTPGLYARKDLFDKYKIDAASIKKTTDIEPLLYEIKKNEKGVVPISLYKSAGLGMIDLLSNGYQKIDNFSVINLNGEDKYKVLSLFELPCMLDGYKFARKWFKDGLTFSDAATKEDVTAEQKANKIGVMIAGNIDPLLAYPNVDANMKAQFNTELYGIPFGVSIMTTGSITATMNAIPKSSKDPERAMMFLNLLHGDKTVYRTLCNGIEGVHYNKISEDVIDIPADSKYNPGMDWAFANAFNGFLKKGQDPDLFKKQDAANKAATPSPLMGFNFNSEPVKTELAQLNAVSDEFLIGLATGVIDPEVNLPKFIDKLKKAGLDTYLAEMQKQIDAWKAANGK